ncbi:CSL zinc finger-domain-containing protein [Jackrogersella minutella]|nr:CSL zinc finger-domain-containing protein [Jackrogersella minutella]
MAPPISNTSAEPTLYDILALSPKHLEGQAGAAQQQKIVKQAYHRALLKYHPDKKASGTSTSSTPPSPSPAPSKSKPKPADPPRITFTVDQIQHAYSILSSPQQRAEYTRTLKTRAAVQNPEFQTGVETLDLDDLSFDSGTGVYFRACRCGNARGYAFTERNLEEFEDDGALMVECLDCSLWIRVLFAAAEDELDDIHEDAVVAARRREEEEREDAVTASGERRGAGTGKGFKFNWSFNWGISLSGSATAGADTSSGSRR